MILNWENIKKLLIKIFNSKINIAQIANIIILIIASWNEAGLIASAWALTITSLVTLALKAWWSIKRIVDSGFSLDWSIWVLSGLGALLGIGDIISTNTNLLSTIFGDNVNIFIMIYSAIMIIVRTGFTNQTK